MVNLKICVVGAGNWGTNHIKTLLKLNYTVGCVDSNDENLNKARLQFPKISCFSTVNDSFLNNYDGYIIATPPNSHADLANLVISNKKPVLVEKPLCLSLAECAQLKSFMDKYDGKLMVGHLMLFHPAIMKIKSIIDDGKIGDIQYIYSNRLNLGIVRKEENVFWSFAPHDISLFQYFSRSFPSEISSVGGYFLQKNIHDTTITYLKYPNGIQGHIYVSWLHPFKEHRLVIIGSKGSLHFEDSLENKPLLLYEKDSSSRGASINLKNKLPKEIEFDKTAPLENEINCFIKMIKGESPNKSGINEGIDVVRILETASKSITN
tara:strand:+ start:1095 stop:2057 length:963 start_codon:yes stop_codon:yes gene_type:complete